MRIRKRLAGLVPTRRLWPLLLLLIVVPTSVAIAAAPEVGARAPDFRFAGEDGRTYRLADYAGKKGVVLAWFPKAFTPG